MRTKILFVLLFFTLIQKSFAQTSTSRPNILLIMVDDLKWNTISIMDSTYPLQTPNIDRIGNEGANINYYSTNSICIPGRTTLLTGRYGHKTGVMNNNSYLPNDQIKLPRALHDSGYYTALIGKWMVNYANPNPDFDYWLWTPGVSQYYNVTCKYGDSTFIETGHLTDMLTDSAVQLISRIDTPFFLMMDHNAPHAPWISQPQFDGVFNNAPFVHPPNYGRYTHDYPSYLYVDSGKVIQSDAQFLSCMRNYTEMVAGINQSTGQVLDALTARGLLDNTMVIFTTDNGFMIGEHKIVDKYKPYEDCMKMPLLIRYPPWFAAGTTMNDNFALNIDIAPTILEAVGNQDTSIVTDGFSVHNFFNGTGERKKFLYEQAPPDSANPVLRTFRDQHFQYTRYYCLDTTEELFDMQINSLQQINLAHDLSFQNVLFQYRIKLDSIMAATNDTTAFPLFPCYLKSDSVSFFSDTLAQSICDGQIYSFNGVNYDSSGIYTDSFTVGNGYDSLAVLNLQVLPTYYINTISDTICSGEIFNFNGQLISSAGFYSVTYLSVSGCDSVFSLELSVTDLNAFIHKSNDTLFANGIGNIQWIKCNGTIIPGATDSVFVPVSSGSFAAIFSNGTCLDTTACRNVVINGNENILTGNEFSIFPNPSNNQLTVNCNLQLESIISIKDILGRELLHLVLSHESTLIDLQTFSSGIYFISLSNEEFTATQKFIKSR
ncbi:MAG: sulfatase-like hydrolase/transferase [Bacteroidota bacterium]